MTQVAHSLGVSEHTANDHRKAIYRRMGVSSRSELAALLQFEQYDPRVWYGATFRPARTADSSKAVRADLQYCAPGPGSARSWPTRPEVALPTVYLRDLPALARASGGRITDPAAEAG